MNKRQLKKQRARSEREAKAEVLAFAHEFATAWQVRFAYFQHHRRHWLSRTEWERRKAQFATDVATERALIRRMHETHNYTLTGWIPKH